MKVDGKKYGLGVIMVSLAILSLLYMFTDKNDKYEIVVAEPSQEVLGLEEEVEAVEEIMQEALVEGLFEDEETQQPVDIGQTPKKVPVYVCGAVNQPDVYYLDETTIIKDAIMAAGGFAEGADHEAWNLAMEIQKGEKIYVPKVGEQIDKTANSYDNRVREQEPLSEPSTQLGMIAHGLININKANAQELCTLPGIGPAISQNIIAYREANGDFKTLQDLTNVSRIGQKTLEKIESHICFQ